MTVGIRWADGTTDTYHNVDSITKEGDEIVLVSNTGDDVALWAKEIEAMEVGGIN